MTTKSKQNKPVKLPTSIAGKTLRMDVQIPAEAHRATSGGNGVVEAEVKISTPAGIVRGYISLYIPLDGQAQQPAERTVSATASLV